MANIKIIEKTEFQDRSVDTSTWKTVLVDNIEPKYRELYLKKKSAIDIYFKNTYSLREISEQTGVHENEIRRYVKRCLSLDAKGEIWGYRGLVPHKRLRNYERNDFGDIKDVKLTGVFNLLLDKYPRLKEKIINTYFDKDKKVINDPFITPKYLHKKFIKWCKSEGINEHEYPFNTENQAKKSLYRYLEKLENEYFSEAAKRRGEHIQIHANSTGIGNNSNHSINRPFQRVQFDGHKIDAIFSITFTTPEGDEVTKVIDRLWLLAIMDVATRNILGYHISLNKEYSSFDVLHCIKKAIVPKQKMKLTITGLKYPEDLGYASMKIPETQWALWDELLYDNAKANLSENVRTKLTQIVGCSINAGPVKMPERRGLIERFFGVLEENGYHRLPNTTGSNSQDPRRNNAEEKAVKYQISVEHLEEITEILIANYNLTPHEGVNNFKPLEVMKQRIERGMYPRVMAAEQQNEVMFLSLTTQRTIKGSLNSGRRPYIYYEGVEYRNEVLSRSPALVGKKLDLLINVDDLRIIRAFLSDDSEFGVLTAAGKWGIRPHTLQTRKEINRLKTNKLIHFTQSDDPIEIYQRFLAQNALNKKSDRTRLAKQRNLEKKFDECQEKDNLESQTDNLQLELEKVPSRNLSTKVKNLKIPLTAEQEEKQKRIDILKKSKAFKTYNF